MSGFLETLLRKERGVESTVKPRGVGLFEHPAMQATEEAGVAESPPAGMPFDHHASSPARPFDLTPANPPGREASPAPRRSARAYSPDPGSTPVEPPSSEAGPSSGEEARIGGTRSRGLTDKESMEEASPSRSEPIHADDPPVGHVDDIGTPRRRQKHESRRSARGAARAPASAAVSDREPVKPSSRESSVGRPSRNGGEPEVGPSGRRAVESRPAQPMADVAIRQDRPGDHAPNPGMVMPRAVATPASPRRHAPRESRRESPTASDRPVVNVSIGRIEIRARNAPPRQTPRPTPGPSAGAPKAYRPAVTLDDYLKEAGKKRGGQS